MEKKSGKFGFSLMHIVILLYKKKVPIQRMLLCARGFTLITILLIGIGFMYSTPKS